MQLVLGLNDFLLHTQKQQVPFVWDLDRVVNGHMLLMGKSGNGKTHTLRNLIGQMMQVPSPPRVHVMDVHGDIALAGASTARFSESSEFGFNPLTISADPHFGGVRRRVQELIATLDAVRALGTKQEAVLRALLFDLFAANGFYPNKPESWRLHDGVDRRYPKKYPTLEDAYRFAHGKLKQLTLGGNGKAIASLDELNRKVASLRRKLKQAGEGQVLKDESIDHLKGEVVGAFSSYVNSLESGRELEDFLRYDNKEVLKSVCERLDNLRATGIFKNAPPPFEQSAPVWRYDIAALREEEKRLFVEFRLQELFAESIEQGPLPGRAGEGTRLRHVLILDEAHLFFRDDSDNILNAIAKEGRKFGLAMVCASQSPTHFSDDFVANVATKIVLGIDPMYWDGAVRKMRIDPKTLQFIQPHHTLAVQMTTRGDTRSRFDMVRVSKVA